MILRPWGANILIFGDLAKEPIDFFMKFRVVDFKISPYKFIRFYLTVPPSPKYQFTRRPVPKMLGTNYIRTRVCAAKLEQ